MLHLNPAYSDAATGLGVRKKYAAQKAGFS